MLFYKFLCSYLKLPSISEGLQASSKYPSLFRIFAIIPQLDHSPFKNICSKVVINKQIQLLIGIFIFSVKHMLRKVFSEASFNGQTIKFLYCFQYFRKLYFRKFVNSKRYLNFAKTKKVKNSFFLYFAIMHRYSLS